MLSVVFLIKFALVFHHSVKCPEKAVARKEVKLFLDKTAEHIETLGKLLGAVDVL